MQRPVSSRVADPDPFKSELLTQISRSLVHTVYTEKCHQNIKEGQCFYFYFCKAYLGYKESGRKNHKILVSNLLGLGWIRPKKKTGPGSARRCE